MLSPFFIVLSYAEVAALSILFLLFFFAKRGRPGTDGSVRKTLRGLSVMDSSITAYVLVVGVAFGLRLWWPVSGPQSGVGMTPVWSLEGVLSGLFAMALPLFAFWQGLEYLQRRYINTGTRKDRRSNWERRTPLVLVASLPLIMADQVASPLGWVIALNLPSYLRAAVVFQRRRAQTAQGGREAMQEAFSVTPLAADLTAIARRYIADVKEWKIIDLRQSDEGDHLSRDSIQMWLSRGKKNTELSAEIVRHVPHEVLSAHTVWEYSRRAGVYGLIQSAGGFYGDRSVRFATPVLLLFLLLTFAAMVTISMLFIFVAAVFGILLFINWGEGTHRPLQVKPWVVDANSPSLQHTAFHVLSAWRSWNTLEREEPISFSEFLARMIASGVIVRPDVAIEDILTDMQYVQPISDVFPIGSAEYAQLLRRLAVWVTPEAATADRSMLTNVEPRYEPLTDESLAFEARRPRSTLRGILSRDSKKAPKPAADDFEWRDGEWLVEGDNQGAASIRE